MQLLKPLHTLPLSPAAPRAAAAGPGGHELLMPSNPDHLPTQPRPLLFPPIPTSLDVFSPFALHLPTQNFCYVSLHGRTLASSQGFQGAPAPRQDGEPPSERCLGSHGGRKSEPCPAPPGRLPQEGFPGSERTKVLRKELGIRISQSQTGTSLYHFKVLFRGGEGKSVSFPVAFIPEAEREGGKKKGDGSVMSLQTG